MNEIFDKLVLFLYCTTLYLFHSNNFFMVIPFILSIVLSCLFIYFEDARIKLVGNIIFILICLFMPDYIIFLPLLLYDIFRTKYQLASLSVILLFIANHRAYTPLIISFTFIILIIGYLLRYKTFTLNKLLVDYNELRDTSTRMSQLLEEKNQSLLKNQDYEINLATLNERNRIAREIHDNIGHLLSRALLQIGALLTVSKEEETKEGLRLLKDSISDGMDQIRNSIHKMYEESVDLYIQIDQLVKDFTFCNISFDYDIKNQPDLSLRHSIIAICKEALANIIRHSNATKAGIILREHPAMYQLVVYDNGHLSEDDKKNLSDSNEIFTKGNGIGLRNIYDRVMSFRGNININVDQGFRIFITIPKKSDSATHN